MEAQIKSKWDGLEQRRLAMVQRVRDLPSDRQNIRPDAHSFTPVELLMHMAMSDAVTIERIKKHPVSALNGVAPKPTFLYKIIVSGMNAGRRVPAPPNMKPEGQFSLDEAAKKWESVRRELSTYFEMASTPDTVVQKSFMFGRLSASNLLALIESHHNYHDRYFPANGA